MAQQRSSSRGPAASGRASDLYAVRADFDDSTIVVYQAYAPAIADAALRAGRFVAPFSFRRMTWIKPSLPWLLHRSNWGAKAGQERVLAVRITRAGWEQALAAGELTTGDQQRLAAAEVHVQWDPERSLRGAALNHYSIQVGLGRETVRRYAEEWIVGLTDLTPQIRRAAELVRAGRAEQARRLLPDERRYPLPADLAARLCRS
ncbi:DUF4291 domain-containing protein [Kitasatospora cheerisanensis]|uniref:DUF4291 domain-containing protein n=1 Tax=Kitasatospora cheerisanensis KCTC 2395 TaxID=1348663 RepID=A0A066Z2M5_9ACTN|nr:DUF4291 domain-containing protein [Kitasatospora cheerisanensis]KDN87712.1 hypothetical protein KCH_03590 [Kitasatospora cheerisanensis KCTC 2395]